MSWLACTMEAQMLMTIVTSVATLPALHLPNGDLLPSSAIHAWIAKQRASAGADSEKAGYSVEKDGQQDEDAKSRSENTRIQVRTYTHLIDGKLQPALVRSCSTPAEAETMLMFCSSLRTSS